MPTKTRSVKSTAPSPSPGPAGNGKRSTRSISSKTVTESSEDDAAGAAVVEGVKGSGKGKSKGKGKGKGKAAAIEAEPAHEEEEEEETGQPDEGGGEVVNEVEDENDETDGGAQVTEAGEDGDEAVAEAGPGDEEDAAPADEVVGAKLTMEERMAKLKELRTRMNTSTAENRRDLIADHQKQKVTAKELARLEKQRKLAQTLRLKADAEASGEDLERKKAWEWSIEDNERWEKKMEEQKARSDTHFHNANDDAAKKYDRNIRTTKPDLLSYERAKEAALGLAPGTLVPINATATSLAVAGPSRGLTAAEDLYRGADTLAYGDNKPSEDAIDRVMGKINKDIGKKKRKEKDDSDEPVTYINDRNKVFNKKIARYFDKYTKEIRASFERGTAL